MTPIELTQSPVPFLLSHAALGVCQLVRVRQSLPGCGNLVPAWRQRLQERGGSGFRSVDCTGCVPERKVQWVVEGPRSGLVRGLGESWKVPAGCDVSDRKAQGVAGARPARAHV